MTTIDLKLKYQAAIFTNSADITPTQQHINILMNEFADKEMIPATFQELPIVSNSSSTRLRLVSPNKEWAINFASTRIDFYKNPTDIQGNNLGELSEFCQEAIIVFNKILSKYPKKANRLALITQVVLNEMSDEQLNKKYSKLFNAPKLYQSNPPFEWSWRSASTIPYEIKNNKENINVITALNRILGEISDKSTITKIKRIDLNLDINTDVENIDYRFDINALTDFFTKIPDTHNNITNEIIDFIK